ncbi:MAG TPA: hypothetical protein VN709_00135 [Terriglobales bacterium]|nr:hypothetical protein [Terriglobales bacterium]
MSTVRSIDRRLYVRRQLDREAPVNRAGLAGAEVPRHMEWNGVWTGYMTFAGLAILLTSFVFGVGFSSLNPMQASSWSGAGGGVAVWSVIVVLISLFFGAWVAGRTPRTSKRHGMMRGITLWGMVLLTTLLLVGWVAGTAVSAAGGIAGSGLGTAVNTTATALQGQLQSSGINVTQAQATTIAGQLAAGDRSGAANTLANDANISTARANSALAPVSGATSGVASTAATGVKKGGASLSWGIFWIALIGLGCALLGGAVGGGGMALRRPAAPRPSAA